VSTDRPLRDRGVEGADRLGDRHIGVVVVGEVQIDLIDAEPVKTRQKLTGDPLRCEAVVGTSRHRVERLGGDQRPDAARSDPAADRLFAASAPVGVGGVEVGDAKLPGSVHELKRLILGKSTAEELRCRADPAEISAAKRDSGYREARPAEVTSSGERCSLVRTALSGHQRSKSKSY